MNEQLIEDDIRNLRMFKSQLEIFLPTIIKKIETIKSEISTIKTEVQKINAEIKEIKARGK
jgi:uncharacterized protein (UPF0335 family)